MFQLGQLIWSNTSYLYGGFLSNQDPPAVMPQGALMQMLWRHIGRSVLNVSANSPGLRCFATIKSVSGQSGKYQRLITLGSWRPFQPGVVQQIRIGSLVNLPSTFQWKLRRYDFRDRGDGRALTVGEGNQSNFPRGIDLTRVGFCQLEITDT